MSDETAEGRREVVAHLKIDPEFQALIPPLSEEEYAGLEDNLRENGCRDPLVVWNGVLLDGHHRFEICQRLKIEYRTFEQTCQDRDSAKIWIIRNQFDRRNLTSFARSELALKLEPLIQARAKVNQRLSEGRAGGKGCQNSDNLIDTKKELAKLAQVSHDTIHKAKLIVEKAPEEVKEKLRRGKTTINREYQKLNAKKPSPAKRRVKHFEGWQKQIEQSNADILAALERLADGMPRSDAEITKITGRTDIKLFLNQVRLIPWLTIKRTSEGKAFQIDKDLREICDRKSARPELEFKSIFEFLREMRAEIKSRRDNNHERMTKTGWTPTNVIRVRQIDLLNYIEQQLDRLPTL